MAVTGVAFVVLQCQGGRRVNRLEGTRATILCASARGRISSFEKRFLIKRPKSSKRASAQTHPIGKYMRSAGEGHWTHIMATSLSK